MLKAVIFDFDGLLSDSTPLHKKANQQFLHSFGKIHISSHGGREGMRIIDIVREYKDIYDLPGKIEDLYQTRQKIFYRIVNEKLVLFDCVYPLLEKLHIKKLILALATSGDRNYINLVFKKFPKLVKYFSVVVTGDDVIRGKPYPDIYQKILKMMNLRPDECVVIEDSINGILAGKAAGITAIAIPNKYYPEADYSIADKSFSTLEAFLKSLQ